MKLDSDTFRDLWLVLIAQVRKKYSRWCRRLYWSDGMITDWAEDIAQDGLLAAQVDMDKYDPERSSFSHWCWLKTSTMARDNLLKREKEAEMQAHLVREHDPQSYDPIESFLTELETRSLLEELRPEERAAMGLYHYGLKVPQIARIMGFAPKTIYTLLDRGRKKLRDIEEKTRAREGGWKQAASGEGVRPPPPSKIIPLPQRRQRRLP